MVSHVIITLKMEDNTELDVEVPCQIPIQELREDLLRGFQEKGIGGFDKVSSIRLTKGNAILQDDKSLAQLGIWDGSILTVITEG